MDHPVLDHDGPWTEDDYLALTRRTPGDGRVELVDGALVVGPGATPQCSRVLDRIRLVAQAALPDGLRVLGPVPVRLGPDCVLVPDLVVARAPQPVDAPEPAPAADELVPAVDGSTGDHPPGGILDDDDPLGVGPIELDVVDEPEVLDAADVLVVVEVVGREHGATDRIFKPQIYARARIPYSLLVDHDGPFAVADMIIGGRYHEYARASGDAVLHIDEPFRLEIDLATVCGTVTAAAPH